MEVRKQQASLDRFTGTLSNSDIHPSHLVSSCRLVLFGNILITSITVLSACVHGSYLFPCLDLFSSMTKWKPALHWNRSCVNICYYLLLLGFATLNWRNRPLQKRAPINMGDGNDLLCLCKNWKTLHNLTKPLFQFLFFPLSQTKNTFCVNTVWYFGELLCLIERKSEKNLIVDA